MSVLLFGCSSKKPATPPLQEGLSLAEQQADDKEVEQRAKELAAQVVVTVADKNITMADMMLFIYAEEKTGADLAAFYQSMFGTDYWDTTLDDSNLTMRDVVKETVLNKVIRYAILHQEALKAGLEFSDMDRAECEATVNDVFCTLTASELERGGFTREQVSKSMEMVLYAEKYASHWKENAPVSRTEIEGMIHKEQYKEYKTECLFLPTASYDENYNLIDRNEEEKAEDYVFMQNVLTELKNGTTMQEIKETANQLTYTERVFLEGDTQLEAFYTDAAVSLDNGELSKIIVTAYGYYIIRMVDNQCMDSYNAAVDAVYSAKVEEAFETAYSELEKAYSYKVNEKVWEPLQMGQTVIDKAVE